MKNKGEMISVIVPVYNRQKCIRRCIQSIQKQSYHNLEIIIIDDGSTDQSGEICDLLQKEDGRIFVFHQKNQGVSKARNRGIDLAHGKYIQFVDSDDTVEISMCEKMVSRQKQTNADLIICGYNLIDKKTNVPVQGTDSYFACLKDLEVELGYYLENFLIHSPCNKLYIREKIKDKFDANYSLGEDLLFNVDYLNKCDSVAGIHDALYNYNHAASNHYREDGIRVATSIYCELSEFNAKRLNDNVNVSHAIYKIYINDILSQIRIACRNNHFSVIKEIKKEKEFQNAINLSAKYMMKGRILLYINKFHLWIFIWIYFKMKNLVKG